MTIPFNKRFTDQVTRSVLEIQSPHFYARPSQAQAVRKKLGFVFPTTDRVTRLVIVNTVYHENTTNELKNVVLERSC